MAADYALKDEIKPVIEIILTAVRSISNPRFYETERGFQGELDGLLSASLRNNVGPRDAIVEQEAQKTLRNHGIRRRPDIIIHCPTQEGGNRRVGNYVVILLKRRGSENAARKDFLALDEIIDALDYPLGVFINIDSTHTYSGVHDGRFAGRLHFVAVSLGPHGVVVAHDHFGDNK